jgi:hypothetical protein
MITFEHPPSVGVVLDLDEVELLQRLLRAYRLSPNERDIPLIERVTARLS